MLKLFQTPGSQMLYCFNQLSNSKQLQGQTSSSKHDKLNCVSYFHIDKFSIFLGLHLLPFLSGNLPSGKQLVRQSSVIPP